MLCFCAATATARVHARSFYFGHIFCVCRCVGIPTMYAHSTSPHTHTHTYSGSGSHDGAHRLNQTPQSPGCCAAIGMESLISSASPNKRAHFIIRTGRPPDGYNVYGKYVDSTFVSGSEWPHMLCVCVCSIKYDAVSAMIRASISVRAKRTACLFVTTPVIHARHDDDGGDIFLAFRSLSIQ